jgi:hypothetical protein
MEIRLRSTGQTMLEPEFRQYLKTVNGPSYDVLSLEVMELLGVDPVFEGPQATPQNPYQFSMRQGIEQIDGKWYTKYVLGPQFTDYTDPSGQNHTAQEQEQQYKLQKDSEQASSVRAQRTQLLKDSDWTQVADAPIDKTAWAQYRQQLRDVPSQTGFPWNITWPTQP